VSTTSLSVILTLTLEIDALEQAGQALLIVWLIMPGCEDPSASKSLTASNCNCLRIGIV